MVKLSIDGSKHTGAYRVECECGDHWSGQAENQGRFDFCPALPIAEAVVHMKLQHPEGLIDLRFTARFTDWLHRFWEVESLREATGIRVGR
jgi:hypothetical protein